MKSAERRRIWKRRGGVVEERLYHKHSLNGKAKRNERPNFRREMGLLYCGGPPNLPQQFVKPTFWLNSKMRRQTDTCPGAVAPANLQPADARDCVGVGVSGTCDVSHERFHNLLDLIN